MHSANRLLGRFKSAGARAYWLAEARLQARSLAPVMDRGERNVFCPRKNRWPNLATAGAGLLASGSFYALHLPAGMRGAARIRGAVTQ